MFEMKADSIFMLHFSYWKVIVCNVLCFSSWGTWTAEKMNRSEGSPWNPAPFHYITQKVNPSMFQRTQFSSFMPCPFSFWINQKSQFLYFVFHAFHSGISTWSVVRVRLSRLGCRWDLWLAWGQKWQFTAASLYQVTVWISSQGKLGARIGWLILSLPFPGWSLFCSMANIGDLES